MIADVCDAINTAMKAIGYLETENEETLTARRYTIQFEPLMSDNEQRGAFNSGVIRVHRAVHVRVQYPASRQQKRWRRTVAEEQETIVTALYAMTITGAHQRFTEAPIEESERGAISDIAIEVLGQIT